MNNISVAVLTAPRVRSLIGESLDSYPWDVLPAPYVFAEPNSPSFVNESKIKFRYDNDTTLGLFDNWKKCAKWMIRNTVTRWIMICEDDIVWKEGAGELLVKKIAATNPLDIAFISPYCSKIHGVPRTTGWAAPRISTHGWCGNLALCFTRTSLAYLVEHINFKPDKPLDYVIGRVLAKKRKIVHMPSLIRHLGGEHSTLMSNTSRNINHPTRQTYDCE